MKLQYTKKHFNALNMYTNSGRCDILVPYYLFDWSLMAAQGFYTDRVFLKNQQAYVTLHIPFI